MTLPRAVLMGAPDHFSIRGGANPHTRTPWGRRKRVERAKAIAQWHAFATTLHQTGVDVFVVPANPEWPGLVYPANAGCLIPLDAAKPLAEKRFVLANLLPSRAGEIPCYRTVLERIGFPTRTIAARFEGEADFFPVGADLFLFTFGRLERQRFVPRFGVPPWRRRYGFRTDRAALDELVPEVPDREVLALELRDEAYYHGDTCLAAFGPQRAFVLAWLEALEPVSRARLLDRLGDRVVPLVSSDAALYAANAFRLTGSDGRERLFLPAGVSERLLDEIRARGAEPVPVDVSEFWKKGGGSVKCMIGDLGPLPPPVDSGTARWRERYRYRPSGSTAMAVDP